jgi:hypothetical protein
MGVGGYQRDAGQAAGHQVTEERQPAGAVLGRADLQAEDLPEALGVDPGGDQACTFTVGPLCRTLSTSVGGHECVGASVQRPGPKRRDLPVEVLGHLTDL